MGYRNDPEVTRYDGSFPLDEARARAFIDHVATATLGEPREWFQIGIELPGSGLIGDIGFCVDAKVEGTAELGYRLAREHWGKGYASEAVGSMLDCAFGRLGVHRVTAYIDTRNLPSVRLVERLGFRREGHMIESYREPVGWSDEYLYAVLRREWRSSRSEG
jgi:RimJ/RimL family protein N-acetyltransferase